VILTHPIERRMKTGTGRLTHICITNSIFLEGVEFRDDPRVNGLIRDPRYFPVVLYPGMNAVDVSAMAWPPDRRLLIFVIDTKWGHAKGVLNRSPNLKALPQIRFSPSKPSAMQFREQPRFECLSTIEAVHFLLEHLAPGRPEHANLIYAFDKMVRRQLDFESTPTRRHFYRR
jgi:DTW domain-containing protein YfiP